MPAWLVIRSTGRLLGGLACWLVLGETLNTALPYQPPACFQPDGAISAYHHTQGEQKWTARKGEKVTSQGLTRIHKTHQQTWACLDVTTTFLELIQRWKKTTTNRCHQYLVKEMCLHGNNVENKRTLYASTLLRATGASWWSERVQPELWRNVSCRTNTPLMRRNNTKWYLACMNSKLWSV